MIYNYKCNGCEHLYEKHNKVADRKESGSCPECNGEDTKQVMSTPSFKTCGGGHLQSNGEGKVII